MPKDEFDFDDPLELSGLAFYTHEDTQREMAECFIQEFLLLGYNHKQLLALFRNPHYLGMNMVLQNKGEPFVKEVIQDVFACWGKKVAWASGPPPAPVPTTPHQTLSVRTPGSAGAGEGTAPTEPAEQPQVDPLGNFVPKLNL